MDCSRGSLPVAKKRIKDPKAKLIERERERERVLLLPWKVLRGKQKAKGCCSAMPRNN